MFSEASSEPVGFPSAFSKDSEKTDQEVQTSDIVLADKPVQATQKKNSNMQTEEVVKTLSNQSFNVDNLASFLTRITPIVIYELDKVEKTKAFTSYLQIGDETTIEETKELYELEFNKEQANEFMVSSLDWSCTGNVLAVGFSMPNHLTWCSHDSFIYFYNISRQGFTGAPSQVVHAQGCVRAIAMHPYEPSIVAAGLHSGEIVLWNISNEGKDMMIENSVFHKAAITQLSWVSINTHLFLFSSSIDAHMFMFKVSPKIGSVILTERYVLGDSENALTRPGILCFAFSPTLQGTFIAALEGGGLVQCSTFAATSKSLQGDSIVKDPTVAVLKKCDGQVSRITFSPFTDDLFVTTTQDRKFVIHSLKEPASLNEIWTDMENIAGSAWSTRQANALLLWGNSSEILVYDSNTGNLIQTVKPKNRTSDYLVTHTAFNRKSPQLMAVGSQAKAFIWELSPFFQKK